MYSGRGHCQTPSGCQIRSINGTRHKAGNRAANSAARLGYTVLTYGSLHRGRDARSRLALREIARQHSRTGLKIRAAGCVLMGGERTVTLSADHGSADANQELVLAAAKLG